MVLSICQRRCFFASLNRHYFYMSCDKILLPNNVFKDVMDMTEKRKMLSAGWAGKAAAAAAGLVTGLSSLLGFPSFLCAGAAAAAGDKGIYVFAGALAGALLSGRLEQMIVQLFAALVICALRRLDPFGSRRDEPVYLSLEVTALLMLFGAVMTVAVPADSYTVIMRAASSLLCGAIVFIAAAVMQSRRSGGVYELTGINGLFIGVLYMTLICCLSSLGSGVLDSGRILGVFVLLWAVRRYRSAGGAVIGALTTCGVILAEPSLARNTLLLAAAGVIAGAFTQMGTLAAVMSFLLSALISLVAVGINADTFHMFADLSAGAMLFAAVPAGLVKKLGRHLAGFRSSLDIVGQTTSSRLAMAGETLGEIRRRLDMITVTMDRQTRRKRLDREVVRCVCTDCPSFTLCFEKTDVTASGFAKLRERAEQTGELTPEEVRKCVPCCGRTSLISRAFSELGGSLAEERAENMRMRELRGLLSEQLSSMEDILSDLSFRTSRVRSIDPGLSAQVRDRFAVWGWKSARACVYVDENLCRRADVFINGDFDGDEVRITASLSALLDCDMGLPDVVSADGLTRISFAELPGFCADTAAFTASAGSEYSGDSYEIFDFGGSEKYILLSDGMGTGKRARLDSVFTVSLTRKLICSGLSMTTAHRLINSMLRVKGWEESFATMDLIRIDLSGGSAALLKSGAVCSRLCRDGCVTPIGGQAFPAGILPECVPDVRYLKLFDGDMIVMTSDGADEETADEIAGIAAREPERDLEELVREMGIRAMERRAGKEPDDLTVIAVRVTAGSK